jgi:flagellar motor switch protein FliM
MADGTATGSDPDIRGEGAGMPALGRAVPEPVLAQAEVDALTGFAAPDDPESAAPRSFVQRGGGSTGYDAMPMLDVALGRFARGAGAAMRAFFRGEAALSFGALENLRYGAYLDELELPAQLFGFKAEGWNGSGLVAVSADATYLVLDKLLGARPSGQRQRPSSRPATGIENGILAQFVALLLGELQAALAPIAPVVLQLTGIEAHPRASQVARPDEAVLRASFEIDLDGATGGFELVLPVGTLEPVRHLLVGQFPGEKLGRDELWSTHLATEFWKAGIQAEAVLHEMRLPLGRVLDLAVGDTLMLDVKPTDLVTLRCGDIVLTRGRMGRLDGRIAVKVAEPIRPARNETDRIPRQPARG